MAATTPRPPAWPILIAGGGISSLAFALALRRGAGDAVTVTIAEPGPPHSASGGRAYAVSPASRLMLEALGIWPALAPIAQPIRAMRITDSRPQDAFRPDYLGFRGGLCRDFDRRNGIDPLRVAEALRALRPSRQDAA